MYYLKRLVIILKKTEDAGLFKDICGEVDKCGMKFFMVDEEEFPLPDEMEASAWSKDGFCGTEGSDQNKQKLCRMHETLWITDSESCAEYLSGKSCGVLAYLHDGNRNHAFGGASYAFEEPRELTVQYLESVYRRYAKIPWDILDTDRCHIRETVERDVDAFYAIYSEPSITAYMEALYRDPDKERAYIREYIERVYGFYDFGVWTVIERESGQIIGRAGLSYREGFEEPELGFVIGVPWQRKGYAYEVCAAILNYGRKEFGFEKIQAFVEPGNTPSLRLCEKLGFYKERLLTISGTEYVKMKWEDQKY